MRKILICKTIIIYKPSTQEKAEQLALILSSYELVKYNNYKWGAYKSTADIVVILGKDFEQNL